MSALLLFDHECELWELRDAVVPSFPARHYRFHPFLKAFYQSLTPSAAMPHRRLCISRRAWEPGKTHQRVFVQQDLFETMARDRGFEVVAPEQFSIADQIKMFAETRCQIGEHGSAQHASIFNRLGMTVGSINPLTEVQTNLGRLYGDSNVLAWAEESRNDPHGNTFFEVSPARLEAFFDAVDAADRRRGALYARL